MHDAHDLALKAKEGARRARRGSLTRFSEVRPNLHQFPKFALQTWHCRLFKALAILT